VIAFYENIVEGKRTKFTSSPKTYLFSIGKFVLLNKLKNQKRFDSEEVLAVNSKLTDNQLFEEIDLNHRQQLMEKALNELGRQCREILLVQLIDKYLLGQLDGVTEKDFVQRRRDVDFQKELSLQKELIPVFKKKGRASLKNRLQSIEKNISQEETSKEIAIAKVVAFPMLVFIKLVNGIWHLLTSNLIKFKRLLNI